MTLFFAIAALFIMALGVRIYGAADHPVEFQYVRQYHSALLARHFYYQGLESVPEWKKAVIGVTTPKIHEPPVMEWLAALGYHAMDGEQLWIPRIIASLFWIIGSLALLAILKRFFDTEVALLSSAFYLLVPYGIYLSRSFQPDSLMAMMMLLSILTIVRFYEKSSMKRLVTAAGLSSLALLIKPVAAFLIFGAFISLALSRKHLKKIIFDRPFWLFCLITVAPAAVYYLYQVAGGRSLSGVAQKSILPGLLVHLFYYKGWLYQLERVVGFPFFIAGLIGILMFNNREGRFMAWGLWLGYLCFGLVFTWPFTTHAYYHIVAIPIIALCLGPLFEIIIKCLRRQSSWFVRPAFLGILVFIIALTLKPVIESIQRNDYMKKASVFKEIGDTVRHSTKTVFLSPHEGEPLMYQGWLGGKKWPGSWAFRLEKFGYIRMTDFQELNRQANMQAVKRRFEEDFKSDKPEYFIVTDFKEFEQQPDLKAFLTTNFDKLAETNHYIIFDLRSEKRL